jgi:hypothetical protein
MVDAEIEAMLQAYASAGADRGLFYLSTPITSGRREYELIARLGLHSRAELRATHAEAWRAEVVAPNERDAVLQADLFQEVVALGRLVVNPARVDRPGWSQDDYDALWRTLIKRFPVHLVATPGWAFSRGSRLEVQLALDLGVPVVDLQGEPADWDALAGQAAEADRTIEAEGWSAYSDISLPPLQASTTARRATPFDVEPTPDEAFARQVFVWLVKERNYQLGKFGTALDDEHTSSDGLAPGGWWDRQLSMYFHRAKVLGLDLPNGRQALAKYVATACGLLESVVRVHGSLPAPGASSGHIEEFRIGG